MKTQKDSDYKVIPTRWADLGKNISSSKFCTVTRDALDRNRQKKTIRFKNRNEADHNPQI